MRRLLHTDVWFVNGAAVVKAAKSRTADANDLMVAVCGNVMIGLKAPVDFRCCVDLYGR